MKFKNYLNEIFNTDLNVQYNKDLSSSSRHIASFEIEDVIIHVILSEEFWSDELFSLYGMLNLKKKADPWELSFVRSDSMNYDILNKFDSFKVFSGVKDGLQILLKKVKPTYFYFTAKESSRKKLYNRFAKLLEKELKYKCHINDEITDETLYFFYK